VGLGVSEYDPHGKAAEGNYSPLCGGLTRV
jgi:hypothetical protein